MRRLHRSKKRQVTQSSYDGGCARSDQGPRPTSSGGSATKAAVRGALADIEAVAVSLDSGDTGWVLPDDVDLEPAVEPWAALVPALNATDDDGLEA